MHDIPRGIVSGRVFVCLLSKFTGEVTADVRESFRVDQLSRYNVDQTHITQPTNVAVGTVEKRHLANAAKRGRGRRACTVGYNLCLI